MSSIEKEKDLKEKKVKKKALAVWSERELSSSDESQDDEVANVCFKVNLENELTSQLSNSVSYFSFEELHDAFNELLSECEQMNFKNNDLRKKTRLLESEINTLKSEKEILVNEKECFDWRKKKPTY